MDNFEHYGNLIEESMVPQFILENGEFKYINPAFAELFDYQREDFINEKVLLCDLFSPESPLFDRDQSIELANLKRPYRLTASKKNGSNIHVEVFSQLIRNSSVILGTLFDVSQQVKLQREFEINEQRYQSFFEYNSDMIYTIDLNGNLVTMNPASEKVAGYLPQEVIGHPFTPFIVVEDIGKTLMHFEEALKGIPQHFEISILNKEGNRVNLDCASIPIIIEGEVVGVYGIGKDITEKKLAEQEANYFSYYDPLTDLPNRRLFEDRLSQSFGYAKQDNGKMAVMFLDIDRFKLINDSFGHKMGDELIQLVAARLKSLVREKDTVSRIGGDEFTILLPDIKSEKEAIDIAERVIQSMGQSFLLDSVELSTSTSIGISFSDKCNDHNTLIQQADLAMYHVKSNGKNGFSIYSEEMNTKAAHRVKLENDLRRALELDEFEIHYQPIIDVSSGETRALEALLRWNHPELGMIPPMDFIPIAEDIGIICEIGEWVLRKACTQNKEWQDKDLIKTRLAVNVSIKQLQQPDFYETVEKILLETGLSPEWLCLELTESEMMKNHKQIIETLIKIRSLGVKIFIDDFGTGYSSLSYLKQLPIDYVKIDKSFIQDIGLQSGEAIVRAILALTKQLNLKTVAEGVESQEQLSFLTKEFCEESQGYLISHPLPGNRIKEYFTTNKELIENK